MPANFATTKARQLTAASGGVRRGGIAGTFLEGGSMRGWKPFRPCICVTEPCPCDNLDDLILWLPSSTKAKKTSTAGKVEIPLDEDTEVLVDLQIPMTISQLRQLKEWSERAAEEPPADGGDGTTTVAKGKPVTPAKAAAAAFAVGFALGEKIDEAAGLSDKISDWAADNIPWPF